MEHLDTFLARQPPFDGIAPERLRELAAQAREQSYAEGEAVLVEDGPPAAMIGKTSEPCQFVTLSLRSCT